MFGVNGLNFNNFLLNEWIGAAFNIEKNNGLSIVINYTNNNGLEVLNQGSNTNDYITNYINDLNQKLDNTLTNQEKNWLFANPKFVGEINGFLIENSFSTEAKEFINISIETLMNDGIVDFEDKIINELTGAFMCL